MDFIRLENLVKKYNGNAAVSGISLTIKKGELFGLLGPNGAGKSTTISMIVGLLKPAEGSIFINGEDALKNSMSVKKLIGLVPQDIALYPTLTARENLAFWGRMYGLSGKTLKERINEVLEIASLDSRKDEKIQNYSGGMKRRINIAAALLHRPEILIMDEPTVGIDPQSRNHILETVKKLNRDGMTVIYTSHYMEEVEYLCTRIGIIDHGKIIALGEKDELKKSLSGRDRIEIIVPKVTADIVERIKSLGSISKIERDEDKLSILAGDSAAALSEIFNLITKSNKKISSINIEEPNLESVFLNLTGRALRD